MIKNPILNLKSESNSLLIELLTVKNFLKIDFEDDDELINKLIKTAIAHCETFINKTLIEKTYIYSIYNLSSINLPLPFPSIKLIQQITLIKTDQTSILLEESEYILDTVGGIINFKKKPDNIYRIDIEYTAGTTNINEELIQGILMHIARMYEDRSGYSPIPLNSLNIYKKYKQIKL